MSWLTSLSETYDNFYSGPHEKSDPIVPVGFIQKDVLFTVRLDENGNFVGAERNDKKTILIPSSPEAAGRTGPPTPYPLYDEMRYMSGDLSGMLEESFEKYFESYIVNLRKWAGDENAPGMLRIILNYLERKTLATDLKNAGYITDKDFASDSARGKLSKGMVELQIHDSTKFEYVGIADFPEVQKSWSSRLVSKMGNVGLCYASGDMTPITDKHPKLFGNTKLISSKDAQRTFQYKGRFKSAEDACMVGYETSEKAHNTLRWLINRQGFKDFSLKFVAWSKECYDVIQPDDDFAELLDLSPDVRLDTADDYSKLIAARLSGFNKDPAYEPTKNVVLMGLEAATPGRISINYYEELGGREYLDRIGRWYQNCFWRISWYTKDGKRHTGIATPTLGAIGNAVFGRDSMKTAKRDFKDEKSITKQVRHFYLNMLSYIAGGRRVPLGYAMTAYHRVLKPQSFRDSKGKWKRDDWIDCMGVSLAMLKSAQIKEDYNVALNEKETDRSYLYGRLTAVADMIESRALREADSERMTNAVRLFTAMQQRPATTWQSLELKLTPYLEKLTPASARWYKGIIDSVFELGDGLCGDNSPLSPRFVEGYHNQRYALLNGNKKKEN